MAVDLLIRDATIVDGTGRPAYIGHIAIQDGRIVAVGAVEESAARTVSADGLVAAPGFWDIHTHYDAQLLWDPLASSSSWHGVTTVVIGNCGFTIAPVRRADQSYLMRLLARVESIERAALETTLPWEWETFGEYLDVLDRRLGVNVITQVGHSAVRRYVMGEAASERAATEAELAAMRQVVRESLRAGAMGFTTSRLMTHWDGDGRPVPSRLATDAEYRALVSELRQIRCGFVELSFAPNDPVYNRLTPEGIANLDALAQLSGRPVCTLAIMQAASAPPDHWRQQLDLLERAIAEGRRFFALGKVNQGGFEMTFENTNVFDRWPTWQQLMIAPLAARKAQMRDPAIREQLRAEMREDPLPLVPIRWSLISLAESASGRWRAFEGQTIEEIAAALGKDPLDTALDIALDEDLQTHFRVRDTRFPNKDIMADILKADHIIPGESDAGAHMVTQVDTGFPTHLLGYWVRERGLISLEHAIQLLATRPADEAGVTNRGRLLPGQAADLVLFDPATVRDGPRRFVNDLPGGARRLVQDAIGIEAVYVNGICIRQGNRDTGDLGGRVIRSSEF